MILASLDIKVNSRQESLFNLRNWIDFHRPCFNTTWLSVVGRHRRSLLVSSVILNWSQWFPSGLSNSHSLFVPPPIVSPLQGCSASHFGQPTMFFSQLIQSEVLAFEFGYSCSLNIWKCSCLNPIKLCQLLFLDPKSQLGSTSGGYYAKSGVPVVHWCTSDCCTTADLFP